MLAVLKLLGVTVLQAFHTAENSLKRIATVGNAQGTNLPTKERVVRLNVMRSLASEIQTLSKSFRRQQKEFVLSRQRLLWLC